MLNLSKYPVLALIVQAPHILCIYTVGMFYWVPVCLIVAGDTDLGIAIIVWDLLLPLLWIGCKITGTKFVRDF